MVRQQNHVVISFFRYPSTGKMDGRRHFTAQRLFVAGRIQQDFGGDKYIFQSPVDITTGTALIHLQPDKMELKELESAIEGILFAAGDPMSVERLCLTLGQDRETVDSVCQRMADSYSYDRRGIRLVCMEDSYQLCSAPEYAEIIRKAFEIRKTAKLSQPALEVLAIVAYYQPVTRAQVDQIRGVDSAYTVGLLLDRKLIEECGRLQVPGRPRQYRTTQNFLRSFHIKTLDELPPLPGWRRADRCAWRRSLQRSERKRSSRRLAARERRGASWWERSYYGSCWACWRSWRRPF